MQRNKRLMKTQKARQKKRRNARVRKQQEAGQKGRRKSGKGLLDVARCTAKLRSGKRCSRTAERKINGKWRCWQHGK